MLVFSTKKKHTHTKTSSGGGLKLAVSILTYILQNGGALSFSALYCIRFEVFLNFSSVFFSFCHLFCFSVEIQYLFPQNRLFRFIYDSFNLFFFLFVPFYLLRAIAFSLSIDVHGMPFSLLLTLSGSFAVSLSHFYFPKNQSDFASAFFSLPFQSRTLSPFTHRFRL